MTHRTLIRAAPACAVAAHLVGLVLTAGLILASTAAASVLSTVDPGAIAAFQSGRTVLDFDELVVPVGPCYIPLDRNQYAALGIIISAQADGSDQTNLAQMPGCGHFGSTLSPPNIIGGGTGPGSLGWRESVRFDFPSGANAIGASSDWSGSNTTLTAYSADGNVIASVSGDQGAFMGILEPDIAYAVWKWNYDEAVAGFSLDNVTFSLATSAVDDPASSPWITSARVEPNPFDAGTLIRWNLPASARVRVGVFDVSGRRVAALLDAERPAGEGIVHWDARDDRGSAVPAGVYFVRLDLPGGAISRRIVRLR
ncbi:MAG: T9SS type A sorting domain-containing protein [bacterium]|nr:T9SS type A sorting domain-containing protein [bacterium]